VTDALTFDGARRLGHIIESYWAAQGLKVITHIDEDRQGKTADALYCVRSDMINGQPTRKLARM
jgi:hypothetical protein